MFNRWIRHPLTLFLTILPLTAGFAADDEFQPLPIIAPGGFVVELAAKTPLVQRPMLASFDDHGRLYVADSAGVDLRGEELLKDPPHSIRMLEDTDGDGIFDKSTVFADRIAYEITHVET